MKPLLKAEALGKAYPKTTAAGDRARAMWHLLVRGRLPADLQRPVLSDVNFELYPGQRLGVIGRNGAGKSTLLKLLTGVLTPSSGRIERRCRIGALLELGAGFHMEYTGRQNIDLSAALLGLSPREIKQQRDAIIDFAELGEFIDEPVKHYSTGMVVRLGFAILAVTEPELLITDEVLAVGDESFQKKCIRWIEQYLERGGTLVLVSHSMYHIQKLCTSALWINAGRVERQGDVFDVTQAYLAWHERIEAEEASGIDPTHLPYHIAGWTVDGDAADTPITRELGCTLSIEVQLKAPDGEAPALLVGLTRADGSPVYGLGSEIDGIRGTPLDATTLGFRLQLGPLPLLPGHYQLRVHAMDPSGVRLFDTQHRELIIRGQSREFGFIRLPYRWD